MAGSSPKTASVSSRSHQKVGLSGEVFGQKQPAVQSRYSANAKHSTPMWKYRIFRAAPICVFAKAIPRMAQKESHIIMPHQIRLERMSPKTQ